MTIDELAARLKLEPPDAFAARIQAHNERLGAPRGPKRRTGRTTRLLLEALTFAEAGLRVCVVAESESSREVLLEAAMRFAWHSRLHGVAAERIDCISGAPPKGAPYQVVLYDYSGPGRMTLRPAN